MDILTALWNGRIYPFEQYTNHDNQYDSALREVSTAKESLYAKLSPELQQEIEELFDRSTLAGSIAEQDAFLYGFRLAVQLLIAGLDNFQTPQR